MTAIPNPLINITLQGRHDTYPKRRGLTRVKEMQAHGHHRGLGAGLRAGPVVFAGHRRHAGRGLHGPARRADDPSGEMRALLRHGDGGERADHGAGGVRAGAGLRGVARGAGCGQPDRGAAPAPGPAGGGVEGQGGSAWKGRGTMRRLAIPAASARFQSASDSERRPPSTMIPALATTARRPPCQRAAARSCRDRGLVGHVDLERQRLPPPAISSATAAAASRRRSAQTTANPSAAKRRAVARPMPDPAPVTSATGIAQTGSGAKI
jgi:hypothetical protein